MKDCTNLAESNNSNKFVVADLPSIRKYILNNPRLKSIEKVVKMNIKKIMDIEERKQREKIHGRRDAEDSPNDEFRLDIKAASLIRKKKDEFVIDYIDPLTNSINAKKLYED
jgi:hypothetical protein